MKINVISIIRGHWATLYDAKSSQICYTDIMIFYVIPTIAGIIAYYFGFKFKIDVFNVSITFFGIFLALLLNIQVAIFGIFQRKWDIPKDKRQADVQHNNLVDRRKLLSELNTNIAYLIVVSSISLVTFLIFFAVEIKSEIGPAITITLYSHFILTFVMIVKRSYALFQKEYGNDPN